MTSDEFNEKYKDYLEPRFEGLEIENEEITALCDKHFKEWIKVPGFQFAQIKSKFGSVRIYCDPIRELDSYDELESDINKILNKRYNG